MTLYVFLMFLHVLAAMIAFGTALLAFPFIGSFASKEPAHLNFALRLNYALGRRAITPIALATGVLGIVLAMVGGWDIVANEWLWISLVLFVVVVLAAQIVTLPAVARLAELTSSPPPPGAAGPPPEVAMLIRRVRVGGMVTSVLIGTIVLLMIWKPGA